MYLFSKTLTAISLGIALSSPPWYAAAAGPFLPPQDLGTLATDNTRWSDAYILSADGRTVAGWAEIDDGNSQAFVWRQGDTKMTGLGTMESDNAGWSGAYALSADGRTVAGGAKTDGGDSQAFVWRQGDTKMTGLGTLKIDNAGWSGANALSADGSTVAGWAETDGGDNQAFVWRQGDTKMTGLGTLKSDNAGKSSAYALSADGSTVAGLADTDSGISQAFVWSQGDSKITGLGTLRSDNDGQSYAYTLSADGSTVAGWAETDGGDNQAFVWHQGDTKVTGLGTLKSDNTGVSYASVLSVDGSTVAGNADTDSGTHQAFVWRQGDAKMTGLGTLAADNAGWSKTYALSADGRVVAGSADTDGVDGQAFVWREGDTKMTGLGTLAAGNVGGSSANALSADGSVVAGIAVTDDGEAHAVLWKIRVPEPQAPVVKIVDVDNSRQAMLDTAARAGKVLGLYQGALSGLSGARCLPGERTYCLGAFTQYDHTERNSMTATGLSGAIRLLPSGKLTAGAAINLAGPVDLVSGYDTRGGSQSGLGFFTRWEDNPDGRGLSVDVSGAFIRQAVSIRREHLSNTEAGQGDAVIKGGQARGTVSWGFKAGESTLVSPVAGLTWQDVSRSAYTETRDAEFAAGYGKMGNKSTSLNAGLDITHRAGSHVTLSGGAGADITLSRQREGFTGSIDYIGAFAYDSGKTRDVKPYARAGVSVAVTENAAVRVSTGWQQTEYGTGNVQAGLAYSYRW